MIRELASARPRRLREGAPDGQDSGKDEES